MTNFHWPLQKIPENTIMLFVCHPTILLKHCLQFLLGVKMAPSCIKPGLARRPLCHKVNLLSCVARRPLCLKVNLLSCVAWQPLCQKVNQPRCEVRRRHLIMSCDIFGTGQTNILTLCYLFGKTYKPAHSSATLESLKSTHSTTHSTKGFDRVSAKFEFRCESFRKRKLTTSWWLDALKNNRENHPRKFFGTN